jgi:hypothetical protein
MDKTKLLQLELKCKQYQKSRGGLFSKFKDLKFPKISFPKSFPKFSKKIVIAILILILITISFFFGEKAINRFADSNISLQFDFNFSSWLPDMNFSFFEDTNFSAKDILEHIETNSSVWKDLLPEDNGSFEYEINNTLIEKKEITEVDSSDEMIDFKNYILLDYREVRENEIEDLVHIEMEEEIVLIGEPDDSYHIFEEEIKKEVVKKVEVYKEEFVFEPTPPTEIVYVAEVQLVGEEFVLTNIEKEQPKIEWDDIYIFDENISPQNMKSSKDDDFDVIVDRRDLELKEVEKKNRENLDGIENMAIIVNDMEAENSIPLNPIDEVMEIEPIASLKPQKIEEEIASQNEAPPLPDSWGDFRLFPTVPEPTKIEEDTVTLKEELPKQVEKPQVFTEIPKPKLEEEKVEVEELPLPKDWENFKLFPSIDAQVEVVEEKEVVAKEELPKDWENFKLFPSIDAQVEVVEEKEVVVKEELPKDWENFKLFPSVDAQVEVVEEKEVVVKEELPKDWENFKLFPDREAEIREDEKEVVAKEELPKDWENFKLFPDREAEIVERAKKEIEIVPSSEKWDGYQLFVDINKSVKIEEVVEEKEEALEKEELPKDWENFKLFSDRNRSTDIVEAGEKEVEIIPLSEAVELPNFETVQPEIVEKEIHEISEVEEDLPLPQDWENFELFPETNRSINIVEVAEEEEIEESMPEETVEPSLEIPSISFPNLEDSDTSFEDNELEEYVDEVSEIPEKRFEIPEIPEKKFEVPKTPEIPEKKFEVPETPEIPEKKPEVSEQKRTAPSNEIPPAEEIPIREYNTIFISPTVVFPK